MAQARVADRSGNLAAGHSRQHSRLAGRAPGADGQPGHPRRSAEPSGQPGPARQSPQGRTRRHVDRAAAKRRPLRTRGHAVFAVGHPHGRAPGNQPLAAIRKRQHRSAGRRQPVAGAAGRAAPWRNDHRFLRGRRRQDVVAGRADALHRPPLRLRRLGRPPGARQAPFRA
ncbi:hypothetical protein D3C72_1282810 [compost metagenome]